MKGGEKMSYLQLRELPFGYVWRVEGDNPSDLSWVILNSHNEPIREIKCNRASQAEINSIVDFAWDKWLGIK